MSKLRGRDPTGKAGSWGGDAACFEMSSPEPAWLQLSVGNALAAEQGFSGFTGV